MQKSNKVRKNCPYKGKCEVANIAPSIKKVTTTQNMKNIKSFESHLSTTGLNQPMNKHRDTFS